MQERSEKLRRDSVTDDVEGPPGLEWGAWLELTHKDDERMRPSMMPFFADTFKNISDLLPKEEKEGLGYSWFPTMTMTLEFKSPFPAADDKRYSPRTVGLYHVGRFIQDPSGRHDASVEVWTAPSTTTGLGGEDNWRDDQRCLAISMQMALTVPAEVNSRKGRL